MIVLTLFAFLAGAGTAVTPCVLPVLPAVLSAGASGGRRRPVGVVCGLALSHAFAIVALASLVRGVGVGGDASRWIAIAVLLLAGVALAVPAVGDRVEARLSRLGRFVPASGNGDGLWSGLGLGAALGLLYAPCAGPILAAVISVSATRGTSLTLAVLAVAYAAGSATVLLVLTLGGRRVLARVRRAGRGPALQRALGAVLVLTAAAMLTRVDVRFQERLAGSAPAFLVNPTRVLERSGAVEGRLSSLRGRARFAETSGAASSAASLPRLGPAPDFRGTQRWFNTPGGRRLRLADLRGRVVLIDFWTYTCINCIRTLPFLRALDARYRRAGLTVVGVHTPEFAFEHDAGNVAAAIRRDGLRYPVAQDNAYATWKAWGNQYWPSEYLVDRSGQVRRAHFGEGGYAKTETAVRGLLARAAASRLPPPLTARPRRPPASIATPETYLGADRARGWLPASALGVTRYQRPRGRRPLNVFSFGGTWRVTDERATAGRRASIDATFQAAKVYLVLSSARGRPRRVRVELDGRPHRSVTVTGQRLYELVTLPRVERRALTVRLPAGVSGYAFTFG